MKSLNEQVNEIKAANISLNAKKKAYASLGIASWAISLQSCRNLLPAIRYDNEN